MYIHEQKQWPNFTWDEAHLSGLLAEVRHRQGRLLGRMEALGFNLRNEATLQTLTQDVLKTSEIEGEKLDTAQVRSSIARRLGIDIGAVLPVDRHVEGIVEMMLDATGNFAAPLSAKRLFAWHRALFPTGQTGHQRLTVGQWRTDATGPMQVVSGPYGRERIHFEAPAHFRLKTEMARFLKWFNAPEQTDPVIKAAVAHFWFITIHPFDDGNGRIARALADLLLARFENSPQRFYSLSAQIQRERNDYYRILERSQKSSLNITAWLEWFLNCLKRAIIASDQILAAILIKSRFWSVHAHDSFNERQRAILNRLLDQFVGKLTSSKWAKLAKCSQDTALRDLTDLVQRKILLKDEAGGRSTSYTLQLPD